jgi:hypothetical protein
MLADLRAYYDSQRIGAVSFDCPHYSDCSRGSARFTTAKEAYVGPAYEEGVIPRLLFLSLDSGDAHPAPSERTLEAVRRQELGRDVRRLDRAQHWYLTHELAWRILRHFKAGVSIERITPYFAHCNSAKCCENNPGRRQASKVLYRNCRRYIPGELRVLLPDIVVTQGAEARNAVESAFDGSVRDATHDEDPHCPHRLLTVTDTHRAVWFHTHHPSAFGLFWAQRDRCWPVFERVAVGFIGGRGGRLHQSAVAPRLRRAERKGE